MVQSESVTLPPELWVHAFGFTDPQSLQTMSKVSATFRETINDPENDATLWKHRCRLSRNCRQLPSQLKNWRQVYFIEQEKNLLDNCVYNFVKDLAHVLRADPQSRCQRDARSLRRTSHIFGAVGVIAIFAALTMKGSWHGTRKNLCVSTGVTCLMASWLGGQVSSPAICPPEAIDRTRDFESQKGIRVTENTPKVHKVIAAEIDLRINAYVEYSCLQARGQFISRDRINKLKATTPRIAHYFYSRRATAIMKLKRKRNQWPTNVAQAMERLVRSRYEHLQEQMEPRRLTGNRNFLLVNSLRQLAATNKAESSGPFYFPNSIKTPEERQRLCEAYLKQWWLPNVGGPNPDDVHVFPCLWPFLSLNECAAGTWNQFLINSNVIPKPTRS